MMMKNRFMTAFAFAGLIGFAACAAEEDEVQFDDGATFEEPSTAPVIEPNTAPGLEPAPGAGDTMLPPVTDTTAIDGEETDSITM